MSVLNSAAESHKSNRKDYRKMLNRITYCFRHAGVVQQDSADHSYLEEEQRREIAEEDEDMKEYVKGFRKKVVGNLKRWKKSTTAQKSIENSGFQACHK